MGPTISSSRTREGGEQAAPPSSGWRRAVGLAAASLALPMSGASPAQTSATPPDATIVQTPIEALAADAAQYARRYGITLADAILRLEAQEQTVAATDALARTYADRLAGITIEHAPAFRIVVALTGDTAVADQSIAAEGRVIPVQFRTGALATRTAILAAISAHQAEIRDELVRPPGMGVDPRTGELAVLVSAADAAREGADALAARFTAIAGVPVRVHILDGPDADLAIGGGGRVAGIDPTDGRRYACTTGFVVTDGTRTAVVTAAHCPDDLDYLDRGGVRVPLTMVSAWGAAYQDVQVHVPTTPGEPLQPLFYADTAKTLVRPLTGWRNRASTRAGDFVCHRGERTGYSCAEVRYVDYAPPGDLCAGPCPPDWVAVAGPTCNHGDSGGPVFAGTIAFGLVKGETSRADGTCGLYYYMSTDYLPPGWSLLHR